MLGQYSNILCSYLHHTFINMAHSHIDIAIIETCVCISAIGYRSNIILLHNSTVLPHSKHSSTKLPLRPGLIHAAVMHEYLISLSSTRMRPALNRSFALLRFKRSNMVEICNEIMFAFYPGLQEEAVVVSVRLCHHTLGNPIYQYAKFQYRTALIDS